VRHSITIAVSKITHQFSIIKVIVQLNSSCYPTMQLSMGTLLAAALAVASTMASPIASRNASDPVFTQATPWTPDRCDHSVIGVVAGTSYIQMLRNSWQIKFATFESTPYLGVSSIEAKKFIS
jgi:hypothetical protein